MTQDWRPSADFEALRLRARLNATIRAFWEQLQRVKSQPKIPEWELISIRLMEKSELAIRGKASGDSVLAILDREVDNILEKRRWLYERRHAQGATP